MERSNNQRASCVCACVSHLLRTSSAAHRPRRLFPAVSPSNSLDNIHENSPPIAVSRIAASPRALVGYYASCLADAHSFWVQVHWLQPLKASRRGVTCTTAVHFLWAHHFGDRFPGTGPPYARNLRREYSSCISTNTEGSLARRCLSRLGERGSRSLMEPGSAGGARVMSGFPSIARVCWGFDSASWTQRKRGIVPTQKTAYRSHLVRSIPMRPHDATIAIILEC